ncbi:N-acetyltransferase family protein [Chitinophaga lutea]
MKPSIEKTPLATILPMRDLYLQENNFQIRYNARHERGWTDSYLFSAEGSPAGYGSVAGKEEHHHRDSIFECYILPSWRPMARELFAGLIQASGATNITCQSNDALLTALLYQFAIDVHAEAILFQDHTATTLSVPDCMFRERREGETMPGYGTDGMGSYVLDMNGIAVATGDFYLHYNKPFADLWMEVHPDYRLRGLGSYLLQELKRACYAAGRVPAARCNLDNAGSKSALLKAGLAVSGFMLSGTIAKKSS